MKQRRDHFRAKLAERGMGCALITKPENMRYLTGYTGEGAVYVDDHRAVILTDFRYVEMAGRQAGDCECLRTSAEKRTPDIVRELVGGQVSLAVEMSYMTVSEFRGYEKALGGIELVDLDGLIELIRQVKEPFEQDRIVRASEIACKAFDELLGIIKPGMTEREVQLTLDELMLRGGSEDLAFTTIACAGVNGSLPHAVPSAHKIQKGELLTLDFGAQVDGYKTDMTRTVAIGEISQELKRIYDTVLEAQLKALDVIAPGVVCRDVDAVARSFIDARYPGAFGHSLGHSVGLEIHEMPGFSMRCEDVLKPGLVMTVEPGVYIEGIGGCRIEDTIILKEDGFVDVITAPKELIIL